MSLFNPPNLPDLPITPILPALNRALAQGPVILTAPPGSGKTTLAPLSLLPADWLGQRAIWLLEPRRLAARAAAGRMAALLGEPVGQTVGYHIRFDRKVSAQTRIEVLTEGILTRRLQGGDQLDNVGLIIFDEFHERSLQTDLALALCLDLAQVARGLHLLIMSATLDTDPLVRLLDGATVLRGEGRPHPVTIAHRSRPARGPISAVMARGIVDALATTSSGDLLGFLPGSGEIRATADLLAEEPACQGFRILPLYGDLPRAEQDRVLSPDPDSRRIILATSIAETSLTIEGVRCVVDSGWSRRPFFDARSGLPGLRTVRVSRAAADQRAGRAGRLGPGFCLRLWTAEEHHNLPPAHPPEIVQADLAELVLQLALWGVTDPAELRWLDPPRAGEVDQARSLLHSLAAVDEQGRITPQGRRLAALPLHPRLGHLLLTAADRNQVDLGCDLAAILSEADPLRRAGVDLEERLALLARLRKTNAPVIREPGVDPARCARLIRTRRALRSLLPTSTKPDSDRAGSVGNLLAHAWPDRIARRRPNQPGRYQLAGGREASLPESDPLSAEPWLVAPHLDAARGRIFLAAPCAPHELHDQPGLLETCRSVLWDSEAGRVRATEQVRIGVLVVEEQPLADPDPESVRQALLQGVVAMGLDCLHWEKEARQLQGRVACLRTRQPEAGWPDLGDEALLHDLDWLAPWLDGITTARQLAAIRVLPALMARLDWNQKKMLERDAPETWTAPSGSRIRITYTPDSAPVLAVRIQELFGCTETPSICGGTVPLLLHLLSPARRPVQITADLAGFWTHGYPEVRKELAGRYPKHAWPTDPLTARPLAGVPRRKKGAG
ncbi:MAG: ATP-dependent helicase HrpB [Desulfobulbus sp.]|jgi:ATP-dependent helicase HrpB